MPALWIDQSHSIMFLLCGDAAARSAFSSGLCLCSFQSWNTHCLWWWRRQFLPIKCSVAFSIRICPGLHCNCSHCSADAVYCCQIDHQYWSRSGALSFATNTLPVPSSAWLSICDEGSLYTSRKTCKTWRWLPHSQLPGQWVKQLPNWDSFVASQITSLQIV